MQGSCEQLKKLIKFVRHEFRNDPEVLQSWEEAERKFPQSDLSQEYCETFPLNIPFRDILFEV